jgi:membrane fusion protein, multidrug efflux system
MGRSFWVVIVIFTLLLLAGCGRGEGEDGWSGATGDWAQDRAAEIRQAPVPVEAIEVSRGSVLRRIEGSGTVRGELEVTVVSEAQGVITAADFELGQFLDEGDVLVRVDDTVARLSVEEARGVYESARLDLDAAQRRFENGSASQAELTRARSAANGARARLEAAEKTFRDQTIRAPIAGFVASRGNAISRGNFLNRGVPVARLVDLTNVRVEIGVGERELRYLGVDSEVKVIVSACREEPYPARIHSIAAGSDERTGSFPVVLAWENQCERVRSGMSARVLIDPRSDDERPIVPSAAVRRDAEGEFVYIAEATGDDSDGAPRGVARRRSVTTGDRLGDRVQVLNGVAEGDVVIVSGFSSLQDGQVVDATMTGRSGETP